MTSLSYLFITVIALSAFGMDVLAAENCSAITSTKTFYACALQSDPLYKSSELTRNAAQASRDAISKWPNPEVSMTSVSGSNAGENMGSTELAVTLSVSELFVKRPALSKSGRAEEKVLNVEASEQEFQAKSKIVRDIFRYRQVIDELELVDEAIGAFKKIGNQFRARKARGPEQEITLNLVELASGDYQLKRNHLAVEQSEIEARFRGIFGRNFSVRKEWLPKLKTEWPKVAEATVSKNTFELQKLEAEREKFEAEKSMANAESFPNIEAGPVWERTTEGPTQFTSVGFNVTMDVPILNWNGGARRLSAQNLARAKFNHDYAVRKADLEKDLLIQKYDSAVESLKQSMSNETLKRKHAQIDGLFRQGLASGTTVIEAHRQISEFTESQHEHEIVALESLMYLYLLSTKDPGEVIQ